MAWPRLRQQMAPPQPLVRWMIRRDLAAVAEIERASRMWPWSLDDFRTRCSERFTIGLVAENGLDELVGYTVYHHHPGRIEVLTIAVAPTDRRRGVGRLLIDHLKAKCSSERPVLHLVVPEINLGASRWLATVGVPAVGLARGHFPGGMDGIVFEYHI